MPKLTKYIQKVPYEFDSEIVADYVIGESGCVLYLSLRYHSLHPEYIFTRLRQLGPGYKLRILLVLVDIDDPTNYIRELTSVGIHHEITMLLAWSQVPCSYIRQSDL
jgi:DNA excision repair protein ERCC-1